MDTRRHVAVGVFQDRTHAEQAVDALYQHGFQPEQVSVMIPDSGPVVEPPILEPGTKAEEGAAVGAVTGSAVGTLLGVALSTIVIPGVGPILAGGLLAGILAGAITGLAGGGLVGALIGLNIPEEEAHHYAREFHSGRTLVTVHAGDRYEEAVAILRAAADRPEQPTHDARARRARLNETDDVQGTGSVVVGDF